MAERWVLRCPETDYETDFKTRKAAEGRLAILNSEETLCKRAHTVVRQVWQAGAWVDVPEPTVTTLVSSRCAEGEHNACRANRSAPLPCDCPCHALTSEDKSATIES